VVAAQQTLVANVSTYLTILGQLWTAVVGVADFLQTDDLFQLAEPKELPPLPDLEHLRPWPCCHTCAEAAACGCSPAVVREEPRNETTTPARRKWDTLPPAPIEGTTSQRPPQALPKLDGLIPPASPAKNPDGGLMLP
jgi:cobalt-zinc-cadmium efflux system outer membrane protein